MCTGLGFRSKGSAIQVKDRLEMYEDTRGYPEIKGAFSGVSFKSPCMAQDGDSLYNHQPATQEKDPHT